MSVKNDILLKLAEKYNFTKREYLIPILQDMQKEAGYLDKEALVEIAKSMNLPLSKIYGVATFYNQFRFTPIGKYYIQVCRGTACHVKGSLKVLEALEQELGIKSGETTKDCLFTIDTVACLGACGLAPVVCINGEFYAGMTPDKIYKLIAELRKKND